MDKREKPSVVKRFMSDGPLAPAEPVLTAPETAAEPEREATGKEPHAWENGRIGDDGSVERGASATSPQGRKYCFYNTFEDTAISEIETTIRHIDMCKCDKCFSDICSIVLNNLKPHYVTTTLGGLYDRASLLNVDILSKISVEIFRAIEIVKSNPSHGDGEKR